MTAPARTPGRRPGRMRRLLARQGPVPGLVLLGSAVLALASFALWAVFASPLLAVQTLDVEGTVTVSPDVVRQAAGGVVGQPLARVDTSRLSGRVESIPQVASARVSRGWPHTLRVSVVERHPVAVTSAEEGLLVDTTGIVYPPAPPRQGNAPAGRGLPRLDVAAGAGKRGHAAAATVLQGLPADVRSGVAGVSVDEGARVELTLRDGRKVRWGVVAGAETKNRVLAALLSRPGLVYDVSTPTFPTVR